MENKTILFVEKEEKQWECIAQKLRESDINVKTCKNEWRDLGKSVMYLKPAALVFNYNDLEISDLENLLKYFDDLNYQPVIYNIFDYEDFEKGFVIENFQAYFNIHKPIDIDFGNKIMLDTQCNIDDKIIEEIVMSFVSDILSDLKFKHIHEGRSEIRRGMKYLLFEKEDPENTTMEELYDVVSKTNDSTDLCVEKNIRFAIKHSWQYLNDAEKEEYFPEKFQELKKYSNSKFIMSMFYYVRIKFREYFGEDNDYRHIKPSYKIIKKKYAEKKAAFDENNKNNDIADNICELIKKYII